MLGVLPCAGEGARWGRHEKELLPTGEERWLIDTALDALTEAGVRRICIISSQAKIHSHVKHFSKDKYSQYDLFYVIQRDRTDVWGAMKEALHYAEDLNLFAMPDTMFDTSAFRRFLESGVKAPFSLGTFATERPDRTGVLLDNTIFNKSPALGPGTYTAWGTMVFTPEVARMWEADDPGEFTVAMNRAIQRFGVATFPIGYYYDFASWTEYRSWLGALEPV